MAEVTREPYAFSVEGDHLRLFKDGIEVDRTLLSQVSCEEGRHYAIFPALLMNANFSQEEWDSLQGISSVVEEVVAETASETVAEETPVVEQPVAEEVTPVVAPVSRRGRRRA
jgi:hypothetical protein